MTSVDCTQPLRGHNVTLPKFGPLLAFACCFLTVSTPPPVRAQLSGVSDARAHDAGTIEGVLVVGTKPIAGTAVMIRETGQSTLTDKYGVYRFSAVAPGTYTLVATADGYQKTHITDVVVKPNGSMTLSQVQMHKPVDGVVALEPYVVKGEANNTIELDKYLVEGSKAKPFQDANVDIPRTINDAQPYYIFDSKTIDQSGAVNVEDFLKQRLTMNAVAQSLSQQIGGNIANTAPNLLGNSSAINLRGLGTDKTLVLINGRRAAGPNALSIGGTAVANGLQPELNGIPLSAIDRIEILPSSASGIYGGSALGGVVNVILKREYRGGELRLVYDNTFDTDSPNRTVGISYGTSFADGRTRLQLNAQFSDSESLLLQDRRSIYDRGVAKILVNSPSFFTLLGGSNFLGALPNIRALFPTDQLVLKDGTGLGSPVTFIPAGTSPTTAASVLKAGLIANAGKQNLDLPATTQNPTGLHRQLTNAPTTKSFSASVQQDLFPKLEGNVSWSHAENTATVPQGFGINYIVSPDSPFNPFTNFVALSFPYASTGAFYRTQSTSDSISVGLVAKLPADWAGQFDYTWSRNHIDSKFPSIDLTLASRAVTAGELNPFVDTLQSPPNIQPYLFPGSRLDLASTLADIAARASGPLFSLPWGTPTLTFGLEHRVSKTPENSNVSISNLTSQNGHTLLTTYYARQYDTDSAYGEALLPMFKQERFPFIHTLDLQLSGRVDRYTVDTGTPSKVTNLNTGVVTYNSPTNQGQPFFTRTAYRANNMTIGIKYQPTKDVIVRASVASAFIPPTPSQLVDNPLPNPGTTPINDPKNGNASYAVQTISGGNSGLQPQNSKSRNIGIVWQPTGEALHGLRLNLEYYRIYQHDAIATLTPQQLVDNEATFPNRITRSSGGIITQVNASALNLYALETVGWDFTASYQRDCKYGTIALSALGTLIQHLRTQYALNRPKYDAVDFPSEGGAAKYKGNINLTWQRANWTAGWSARYFGSYSQFGAPGGPTASQGQVNNIYRTAQGSDRIPSQTFHDAFLGYSFKSARTVSREYLGPRLLENLTVQGGVRNVFGALPAFDAYYGGYISPYGDTRLRSYWVSLKKSF